MIQQVWSVPSESNFWLTLPTHIPSLASLFHLLEVCGYIFDPHCLYEWPATRFLGPQTRIRRTICSRHLLANKPQCTGRRPRHLDSLRPRLQHILSPRRQLRPQDIMPHHHSRMEHRRLLEYIIRRLLAILLIHIRDIQHHRRRYIHLARTLRCPSLRPPLLWVFTDI